IINWSYDDNSQSTPKHDQTAVGNAWRFSNKVHTQSKSGQVSMVSACPASWPQCVCGVWHFENVFRDRHSFLGGDDPIFSFDVRRGAP
ncbi:MAG: hypothetical protein KDA57_23165, partial [Planctomycetales bacterium]|nr:hypothetical protein [Planctomycetales bacterium]